MKLLNNASITAKSLISTLIGALVLIALAGLSTFSLLQVEWTMAAADTAVTLLVFGGLHGGNPNVTWGAVIILIVVGLEFGIAYLVTRRLWLPIGMHFSWNLVEGTLLGYPRRYGSSRHRGRPMSMMATSPV